MKRKRFTVEQIIRMLRKVDFDLPRGKNMAQVRR